VNVGGPTQTAPVVLTGPLNVTITVPPGAVAEPVTLRVAQESGSAPRPPENMRAVGSVFAATPHGILFSEPVRVELPLPAQALAADEAYVLLKSQPDATNWEIVPNTRIADGRISGEVRSFSYFVVGVIRVLVVNSTPWAPILALRCTGGSTPGCLGVREVPRVEILFTSNGGSIPAACDAATARL
jgi:hypothetical protein